MHHWCRYYHLISKLLDIVFVKSSKNFLNKTKFSTMWVIGRIRICFPEISGSRKWRGSLMFRFHNTDKDASLLQCCEWIRKLFCFWSGFLESCGSNLHAPKCLHKDDDFREFFVLDSDIHMYNVIPQKLTVPWCPWWFWGQLSYDNLKGTVS